ncbi:MAG: hypothetical protein NVSMB17_06480 [Candidatus Dormibacteria bacterium]
MAELEGAELPPQPATRTIAVNPAATIGRIFDFFTLHSFDAARGLRALLAD